MNKESEYRFIKDWCIEILNYYISISSNEEEIEGYKIGIIGWNSFFEKKKFRGFKNGFNDTNKSTLLLNEFHFEQLNKKLLSKFSKTINDFKE